jgi:hypothetical protein
MNNRQKAKRFKRLYEDILKKPIPTIIKEPKELQHYRSYYVYDRRISDYAWIEREDVRDDYIASDLAKKFLPEIKKHVMTDIDFDTGQKRYFLDIWMVKEEK